MGDLNTILKYHPALADFKPAELFRVRGDVLTYCADYQSDSFSTDSWGFRHSTFEGKKVSVADCLTAPRYGLVLGPSSLFGTGVAGDENCMASLLAQRFGFPFANAAMPGGNSRNLNSLLVGHIATAEHRPTAVVLSNGGDLANFCEAGFADPIFGSPNRIQLKAMKEGSAKADRDANFPRMLTFTNIWTTATATLCRAYGIRLVMVHQSTFFEKAKPSKSERESRLGEAQSPGQVRVFATFRKFNQGFFDRRQEIAERLGVPLAGLGLTEKLTFIDEFHVDRAGTQVLAQDVGDKLAPLLDPANASPTPKPKMKKA